jgi:hypothetical protein
VVKVPSDLLSLVMNLSTTKTVVSLSGETINSCLYVSNFVLFMYRENDWGGFSEANVV